MRYCPEKSRLAVAASGPLILGILSISCLPEILPSIIRRIAVFVVYENRRPTTRHVHPSKSMGAIDAAIDSDTQVAGVVRALSCASSWQSMNSARVNFDKPRKDSAAWVVMKNFAQSLYGNIRIAHAFAPISNGMGSGTQGLLSLSAAPILTDRSH